MIARLLARLTAPYVVRVSGMARAVHYAHTRADALSWVAQYPASFGPVYVSSRRTGRVVARRITVE